MTLVNIDLRNQGYETGPDDRVIFYSLLVREGDFGTISTAPVEVELVDGKASVDLAPGPVGVQIIAGQVADTRIKIGEVPPSGPTTLNAVMMVTPAYTPALQAQFLKAIQDAQAQAITDLERSLDGSLSQYRDYAVEAINVATNVDQRVTALESREGLAPESPTDGQTANLVANGGTLTHGAVAVVAGEVAADAVIPVSKNFAALIQRDLPRSIPIPAEIGPAGGLEISYDGTTYGTNVDEIIESRYRATGTPIYVDPVDGVDTAAADGLSPETAYRTPGYAVIKNPGYTEMIITKSANFSRTEIAGLLADGRTIRSLPGTTVRFIIGDRATWTKNGSVWTASVATANGVIDTGALNLQGDPTMYVQVADVASVTNAPGSWYFSGGTMTIRTIDDRTPDDDVYISRVISGGGWSTTISTGTENVSGYMEGIEFWGGTTATNLTARGPGWKFYAKNCGFHGASGNGLAAWGLELSVLVGCRASYNGMDGFNYTPSTSGGSGTFIEVDCIGSHNGVGGGSQNGSTSHNDYRGIRVSGLYTGNQGANVADVNNTATLNVGCHESDSTDYKHGFYANGTSQMWLDGCIATSENSIVNQDVDSKIYRRATMAIGKVIGEISDY